MDLDEFDEMAEIRGVDLWHIAGRPDGCVFSEYLSRAQTEIRELPQRVLFTSDALWQAKVAALKFNDLGSASVLSQLRRGILDPGFLVVVFGEFSAGKSTLINALLRRNELPAKARPTTGCVTMVRYGSHETLRATMLDGMHIERPISELRSFVELDVTNRLRSDVRSIVARMNSPLLVNGVILCDTPGLNDDDDRTQIAKNAAASADLVLYVITAQQALSRSDRQLAGSWLRGDLKREVFVVLTHLDLIEDDQRDGLVKHVQTWNRSAGGSDESLFIINAWLARKRALQGERLDPADDFERLHKVLVARAAESRAVAFDRRPQAVKTVAGELLAQNALSLQALQHEAEGGTSAATAAVRALREEIAIIEKKRSQAWETLERHCKSLAERCEQQWVSTVLDATNPPSIANAEKLFELAMDEKLTLMEGSALGLFKEFQTDAIRISPRLSLKDSVRIETLTQIDFSPKRNFVAEAQAESLGKKIGEAISPETGRFIGKFFRGVTQLCTQQPCNPMQEFKSSRSKDWARSVDIAVTVLRVQFSDTLEKALAKAHMELEQFEARARIPAHLSATIEERKRFETILKTICK